MRAAREGMQCDTCYLRARRFRGQGDSAVFGAGSVRSGIAFIGEGPGRTEVVRGEPLVGPTGHWFRSVLADAGLAFDDVYRTNAILCEGDAAGSELKGGAWTAIKKCAPSLHYEVGGLIEAGIRVFMPMGNAAFQGLMPHVTVPAKNGGVKPMGITMARGYVWPLDGCKSWVVPTLHPSPKNLKGKESGSGWALMVNDIRKAKRIVAQGGPRPRTFTRLAPTLSNVAAFAAKGPRSLAADVESTMDGRLVCVGFCDRTESICVPVLHQGGGEFWSTLDWALVRVFIQTLLGCRIAFQNGVHDVDILTRAGFGPINWVCDTMLWMHAVYPDQRKSLHHLGSLYGEIAPWKTKFVEGTAPEPEVD